MTKKSKRTSKNIVRRVKYLQKSKLEKEIIAGNNPIYLSDSDRITYAYKRNRENKKISEVVNVSLEIKIKSKWLTIKRYDSSHGFLHRHTRVSIGDDSEIISVAGVKKSGKHSNWLTWSIKDIKAKFWFYKRAFLKRSGINQD